MDNDKLRFFSYFTKWGMIASASSLSVGAFVYNEDCESDESKVYQDP